MAQIMKTARKDSSLPSSSWTLLICSFFFLVIQQVTAIRHYRDGEKVMLYVNKVGPYFNPQETYHYYQLPVCRPEKIEHRSLSLGVNWNTEGWAVFVVSAVSRAPRLFGCFPLLRYSRKRISGAKAKAWAKDSSFNPSCFYCSSCFLVLVSI